MRKCSKKGCLIEAHACLRNSLITRAAGGGRKEIEEPASDTQHRDPDALSMIERRAYVGVQGGVGMWPQQHGPRAQHEQTHVCHARKRLSL